MSDKLKTTPFIIRLDADTKTKAKAKADEQNRSLNNYIVNAVKEAIKSAL